MKNREVLLEMVYVVNEASGVFRNGEGPCLTLHDDENSTWMEFGGNVIWSIEESDKAYTDDLAGLLNEIVDAIQDFNHAATRAYVAANKFRTDRS